MGALVVVMRQNTKHRANMESLLPISSPRRITVITDRLPFDGTTLS
jgi:hypothetical protein